MKCILMLFFRLSFFIIIVWPSCVMSTTIDTRQQVCEPDVPETEYDNEPILMNYQKENLTTIINFFAAKKNVNVILPNERIDAKITFSMDKKVPLNEGWDIFVTLLSLAGYRIIERKNFYKIVKDSKDISREPAHIYIASGVDALPNNSEPVWYVHFFANMRVGERDGEIETLLNGGILPENSNYRVESNTNAVVIMAPANSVKNVIPLLAQLDQEQFQEVVEKIPLYATDANTVAALFNEQIFKAIGAQEPIRSRLDVQRVNDSFYFSRSVRVIAEPLSNSIILIGRAQAVERIRDFIKEYVDKDLEFGTSPYHIYQLRYLAAEDVKRVLDIIINPPAAGGQARTEATSKTHRLFGDVKIMTDKPDSHTYKPPSTTSSSESPALAGDNAIYEGGNRLIVAATNEDWKQIRDLIYKIDQPQPQVLLEILVADLTIDDAKQLGSIIRNPARFPFPEGVGFQAANLGIGVLPNSFDNPQTIAVQTKPEYISSDLLRKAFSATGQRTDDGINSIAAAAPPGSAVVSFNDSDGSTWGILQLLRLFDYTKIISHPHIIATHNQEAVFETANTRQVTGGASLATTVGAIKVDTIKAGLKVSIIPRIIGTADVVNVQIKIDIDDFRGANNTRITRQVITNANVYDNDILAIGGLVRQDVDNSVNKTPLLEQIPIFGWFFKNRQAIVTKTNLTVFISPTIIKPRLRRGISQYTRDYIANIKEDVTARDLFDALRDPITKWFFTPKDLDTGANAIDRFLLKGTFAENYELIPEQAIPEKYIKQVTAPKAMSPSSSSIKQVESPDKIDRRLKLEHLVKDDTEIDATFKRLGNQVKAHPRS